MSKAYEFSLTCKCSHCFRVGVPHFEDLEDIECPVCEADIFEMTDISDGLQVEADETVEHIERGVHDGLG